VVFSTNFEAVDLGECVAALVAATEKVKAARRLGLNRHQGSSTANGGLSEAAALWRPLARRHVNAIGGGAWRFAEELNPGSLYARIVPRRFSQ
jgi:hypothetical protein